MRSLRTKIVLLVLGGCILSAAVVGILSIQNTKIQIQKDSADLMDQARRLQDLILKFRLED